MIEIVSMKSLCSKDSNKIGTNFSFRNNILVHISDVERGSKCGCKCPGCGWDMVANQGNKKKWYFSHANNNPNNCTGYLETILHLSGKQVISMSNNIVVPWRDSIFGRFSEFKRITYLDVDIEKRQEQVQPDIILSLKGGNNIFVEIKVTHGIDEKKYEKIKKMGISTLEIDLHDFIKKNGTQYIDIGKLKEYILYSTEGKKWIYNSKEKELRLDYERRVREARRLEKNKNNYNSNCFKNIKFHNASAKKGPVEVLSEKEKNKQLQEIRTIDSILERMLTS